ncbi:unnamed protein product [Clavelina lepadiformis]|uniref:Uncharacterized protein n=1 Tax=Clavelina lepadiformis TaxID=159417 RepID=A0ABP0GUV0_CLALP
MEHSDDNNRITTAKWYMHKTLTVLKNKVIQIMKLKVCVARHQKIQKKTVGHENVEAKATVEFVVDVHLVLAVGGAQREYGIQGIWHTANGAEMIG